MAQENFAKLSLHVNGSYELTMHFTAQRDDTACILYEQVSPQNNSKRNIKLKEVETILLQSFVSSNLTFHGRIH